MEKRKQENQTDFLLLFNRYSNCGSSTDKYRNFTSFAYYFFKNIQEATFTSFF
jgi:hypothetical protein